MSRSISRLKARGDAAKRIAANRSPAEWEIEFTNALELA